MAVEKEGGLAFVVMALVMEAQVVPLTVCATSATLVHSLYAVSLCHAPLCMPPAPLALLCAPTRSMPLCAERSLTARLLLDACPLAPTRAPSSMLRAASAAAPLVPSVVHCDVRDVCVIHGKATCASLALSRHPITARTRLSLPPDCLSVCLSSDRRDRLRAIGLPDSPLTTADDGQSDMAEANACAYTRVSTTGEEAMPSSQLPAPPALSPSAVTGNTQQEGGYSPAEFLRPGFMPPAGFPWVVAASPVPSADTRLSAGATVVEKEGESLLPSIATLLLLALVFTIATCSDRVNVLSPPSQPTLRWLALLMAVTPGWCMDSSGGDEIAPEHVTWLTQLVVTYGVGRIVGTLRDLQCRSENARTAARAARTEQPPPSPVPWPLSSPSPPPSLRELAESPALQRWHLRQLADVWAMWLRSAMLSTAAVVGANRLLKRRLQLALSTWRHGFVLLVLESNASSARLATVADAVQSRHVSRSLAIALATWRAEMTAASFAADCLATAEASLLASQLGRAFDTWRSWRLGETQLTATAMDAHSRRIRHNVASALCRWHAAAVATRLVPLATMEEPQVSPPTIAAARAGEFIARCVSFMWHLRIRSLACFIQAGRDDTGGWSVSVMPMIHYPASATRVELRCIATGLVSGTIDVGDLYIEPCALLHLDCPAGVAAAALTGIECGETPAPLVNFPYVDVDTMVDAQDPRCWWRDSPEVDYGHLYVPPELRDGVSGLPRVSSALLRRVVDALRADTFEGSLADAAVYASPVESPPQPSPMADLPKPLLQPMRPPPSPPPSPPEQPTWVPPSPPQSPSASPPPPAAPAQPPSPEPEPSLKRAVQPSSELTVTLAVLCSSLATARAACRKSVAWADCTGRQTPRTLRHQLEIDARRLAWHVLTALPRGSHQWYVLSVQLRFTRRLRRAAEHRIIARHTEAAHRLRMLKLYAAGPNPLRSCDVGVGADMALVYRTSRGVVSSQHPAPQLPSADILVGSALQPDGSFAQPLQPPSDSPFDLCPDASGLVCYVDRDNGDAQWKAPTGSVALKPRPLLEPRLGRPPLPEPPSIPLGLGYATLHHTHWHPLYEDSQGRVRLYHAETGAVREPPWVCLRSLPVGTSFYANLITGDTRWFPPHRWMQGWISRPQVNAEGRYVSPPLFEGHRLNQQLLPLPLARQRAECGAPPMFYERHRHGVPQFGPDDDDTPNTHPLAHWPVACVA